MSSGHVRLDPNFFHNFIYVCSFIKIEFILNPINLLTLKGNVWGSWGIKGGLDWVKTRCLVITIYFKPPENP